MSAITGACSFVLGAMDSGKYQFRFFSDNSDILIGKSDSVAITASPVTFTASPSKVLVGESVTIAWEGIINPTKYDWIGLYDSRNLGSAPVDWNWVSCARTTNVEVATGKCSWVIGSIASGDYVFKLFANNSAVVIGTSNTLTVTTPSAQVSVEPTVVAPNSATVTWNNLPNARPLDWIGLFPAGNAQSGALAWNWVNCSRTAGNAVASGSCAFPTSGLSAGTYEFRFFANNSSTVTVTSPTFILSSATVSLSVSPIALTGGSGPVTLTWSNIPNAANLDWIGLYPAGNAQSAALDWNWISCTRSATGPKASGTCSWSLTNLATGTYEFRFFANNSTTLIGTTNSFTVSNPLPTATSTPAVSVAAAPVAVIAPGGKVTVTWSNLSSVSPPGWLDWIAIYPTGNLQAAPIDWNWINCTRVPTQGANAGSCAFTLGTVAAGSYEFRIMANNSSKVIGTSNPFVVGP